MGLRVHLKAGLHSLSTIQVPGGWGVVMLSARAQTTNCHLRGSNLDCVAVGFHSRNSRG